MQTKFYSKLIVLIGLCCVNFFYASAADEPTRILSAAVKRAQSAGVVFKQVDLFTNTTGSKHDILRSEQQMLPNAGNIAEVFNTYPKAISLTLTSAEGKSYTLELMRSNPLALETDFGYIDAIGRHSITPEKAAHYQGAVKGVDQSFAAISVFGNGEVMGLFGTSDGNFVIGKLEDNSGNYVFYNDRDMTVKPGACGVNDYADYDYMQENTGSGNKTTHPYKCKKVSVYWEADYMLYKYKLSSTTQTQNYLTGLFNQVQTLYRYEDIAIELRSISIWTVNDAYDSTSSGVALSDFKSAWNAKGDTFKGNLAMLLARDPGGNGGVAFLNVLNYKPNGYAYGDVDGSYSGVPTYSWDVEMVTHEHGHNLGSRHTHWCGWMTGAGATCGSIDDCTTKEPSTGCSSCSYEQYQNSMPVTAWKGSIMSYCHLVARGTDLANGFGPLPGNTIRTEVAGASALSSIISATFTITPICKKDGSITMKFDTTLIGSNNFAPAPYRFVWSHGPTTPDVYNLPTPGTYSLEITDSIGCVAYYNINVPASTEGGCWPAGISTPAHDKYISVYPNPATQQVSLKYFAQAAATTMLRITDMMGRAVVTQPLQTTGGENNTTIDIHHLTKGVYFIQLGTTGWQYDAVKLVVE